MHSLGAAQPTFAVRARLSLSRDMHQVALPGVQHPPPNRKTWKAEPTFSKELSMAGGALAEAVEGPPPSVLTEHFRFASAGSTLAELTLDC